jgi:hypothetical protein
LRLVGGYPPRSVTTWLMWNRLTCLRSTPFHTAFERDALLYIRPRQSEPYVEGVDVRVNVIGRQVFQLRPVTWALTPKPRASVNCSSECLLG